MSVLSLQSHVCAGHVGNAAAVPALQALGRPVWPVHTVLFSNHPGHGRFTGHAVEPAWVADCVAGLADLPVAWEERAAVLSGYLGVPGTAAVVAWAVDRARAGRPDLPYLCDPVIGDALPGRYVDAAIPPLMRDHLVPRATIVTPNLFELRALTGMPCHDLATALAAARWLLGRGPRAVVVTSVDVPDGPEPGAARCLVTDGAGAWVVASPRLAFPRSPHGAGDLLSALYLHAWLDDPRPQVALSQAVSALFAVLEETWRRGAPELALLAARDRLARPPRLWPAIRL
ncbi:pyridoxal kinase [Roseospira visakhapatnamensis]|uniref:pyridoxal kinase n=1 Tax=Roseospira visakhapatnamensis TaxID=390880 RepID=A0A7W6RHN9_9PROT|nr:pyridoxal kinase [Roseospira visakhapatnamensis]MBB4268063.1 pyridoxine kinase [Roseospira visakhapatnamensis]